MTDSQKSQTWTDENLSGTQFDDSSNFSSEHIQTEQQILFIKGEKVPDLTEVYYEGILSDRGGFGTVHKLYDREKNLYYAMKTIKKDYLHNIRARQSFEQEAKLLAEISEHRNLVRPVSFLTWKTYPCLVMEFVQGVTLDSLYQKPEKQSFNKNRSGNLTYYLQIFLEISRGMSFLWEEKKILHLDLKPSNIIIDERDAIPKILDFGLSRTLYVYQESPLEESLTDLQTPLISENRTFATFINETQGKSIYRVGGTLAYMAPEKFKGLNYCDTRTDIYSMGVLMYEVITGKRPFQPQPGEPLLNTYRQLHENAEIGEIPGCDPTLVKMIYKCLEKSPEKRFNSFRKLFENLNNLYFQETGRYYPMEVVESPDPDVLVNRASLQLNFGHYQQGLSLVEQAIALDPNHLSAQITKVSALCQLHLLKEARELIEDILKRHPDNILALNQAGVVYYWLEMYDHALQCFEKVIFLNPENNEFHRGNLAYTLLQIVNKNIFSENDIKKRIYLDRARKELEIGLKEHPESEYLLSILVEINRLEDLAISTTISADIEQGSRNKFLEVLRQGINKDWNGFIHSQIGFILDSLDQYDEAEFYLRKAIEINDYNFNYWLLLGNCLVHKSQYEEAKKCYEQAIEIASENVYLITSCLDSLTYCYSQGAIDLGGKWLKDGHIPNANFWLNLGHSYDDLNQYDRALNCYQESLKLEENNWQSASDIIRSFTNLERAKEAIAFGESWKQKHSPHGHFWWSLGDAYQQLNRLDEAVDCWALSNNSDIHSAEYAQNKLFQLNRVGLFEKAVTFAEDWLNEEGHHANSQFWKWLGIVYVNLKKYDQAIICYEKGLQLEAGDSSIAGNKIQCLLLSDKPEAAIIFGETWLKSGCSKLEKVWSIDSNTGRFVVELKEDYKEHFWHQLGLAYCQVNQYEKAIECCDKILVDISDANAASNKIYYLSKLGRSEDAINFGQSWKQKKYSEPNIDFYNYLGLAYDQLNQYDQAVECCEQALILDNSNVNIAGNKLDCLTKSGKLQEAIAFGESWLKFDGNNPNSRFYNLLGLLYYQLNQYEQGLNCFNQALILNIQDATVAGNKLDSLRQLKRTEEAIAFGESWLKFDGNNPNSRFYNLLGLLYDQLNQYEQGLNCFEKGLILDYSDVNIAFNKLNTLQKLARIEEAIAFGESWIKEHQPDANFWIYLGYCYYNLKRYIPTLKCIDQALALDNNAMYASNKIQILCESGRTEEAIAFGESWLKFPGNNPNTYFNDQLGYASANLNS